MKNIFLHILVIFFGCQQNKLHEEKHLVDNIPISNQYEQEVSSKIIIPILFEEGLIFKWNTVAHRLEKDSIYYAVRLDKEKLKYLVENISNDDTLNIRVCSKNQSLKKGDVAFIYLMELGYIQNFKCLKKQFDVLESGCPYPFDLLDYIEINRKDVALKVKTCISF